MKLQLAFVFAHTIIDSPDCLCYFQLVFCIEFPTSRVRSFNCGLKVGVAFTRFQTRYFQGKYGNLDARLISYGPCQTPTLNFCVERHQKIVGFEAESFWTVKATLMKGGQSVDLQWARGRVFDQGVAGVFLKLVSECLIFSSKYD